MTTKPARLTAEREGAIRADAETGLHSFSAWAVLDLLAEIDALREELAEARASMERMDHMNGLGADALEACQRSRAVLREQLATAEARGEQRGGGAERAAVVAWLRRGDDQLGPGYEGPATSYAAQIERGGHVRSAPAEGAGK